MTQETPSSYRPAAGPRAESTDRSADRDGHREQIDGGPRSLVTITIELAVARDRGQI